MNLAKAAFSLNLIVACLCGCAAQDQSCQTDPVATLPIFFAGKFSPFTLATVNGQPAAMMVDTGATASFLTPNFVANSGLKTTPLDPGWNFSGGGGAISVQQTKLDSFDLGSASGSDLPFAVIALTSDTNSPLAALDGAVGSDILHGFNVELDFPDGKLVLYPKTSCSPPAILAAMGSAIPATLNFYGAVTLQVQIDGKNFTALLDSGAAHTFVPHELFKSYLAGDAGQPIGTNTITTASGIDIAHQVYRVKQIVIGNEVEDAPLIEVPTSMGDDIITRNDLRQQLNDQAEDLDPSVPSDQIILGEDFIKHHKIFIAYGQGQLFIGPASSP